MLHQLEFDRRFAIVQGRLRLNEWRNSQTEQITNQFEAAWPELEAAIEQHVAELSLIGVARAHAKVRGTTQEVLAPWAEVQAKVAAVRAQDNLSDIMALLSGDGIASQTWIVLPTVGGFGLIAASALVIAPSITGLALLGSPVLLTGGAVLAVLTPSIVGKSVQRERDHLVKRMKRQARSAIFGDGRDPSERCIGSDIQAAVLKAAQSALEAR